MKTGLRFCGLMMPFAGIFPLVAFVAFAIGMYVLWSAQP